MIRRCIPSSPVELDLILLIALKTSSGVTLEKAKEAFNPPEEEEYEFKPTAGRTDVSAALPAKQVFKWLRYKSFTEGSDG
jgi:hypothetical protein